MKITQEEFNETLKQYALTCHAQGMAAISTDTELQEQWRKEREKLRKQLESLFAWNL